MVISATVRTLLRAYAKLLFDELPVIVPSETVTTLLLADEAQFALIHAPLDPPDPIVTSSMLTIQPQPLIVSPSAVTVLPRTISELGAVPDNCRAPPRSILSMLPGCVRAIVRPPSALTVSMVQPVSPIVGLLAPAGVTV